MHFEMTREHRKITRRINEILADSNVQFVVIIRETGGDLTYMSAGSPQELHRIVGVVNANATRTHVTTINRLGMPIDMQIRHIPAYWGDAATVDTDRELVTA